MNSQVSSRIVKTWRNKLQSVVHKIPVSWEFFTDLEGFMLTGYSQSSSVGFYWIVSLNWGKTLKTDHLAVLWPLVLFSVRYPGRYVILEIWAWPCVFLVSERLGGSFYHCICNTAVVSLVFCLLAWVIPCVWPCCKWNCNAEEAWHCGSGEVLLNCTRCRGWWGKGQASLQPWAVLPAVLVGVRAQWRWVRLRSLAVSCVLLHMGTSLFIDTANKKECIDILQN